MEIHPISETEMMKPCKYINPMCDGCCEPSIADWVGIDENPEETINDLIERCQRVGPYIDTGRDEEGRWIIFREGFVKAFFEKAYHRFKKTLDELVEKANPETMCGFEISRLLFDLQEEYEGKFDWYIDGENLGLLSFKEFIREIEPNTKYYFGGTADVHF